MLSFSDGKEATAKAASFLYSEFLQATKSITDRNPTFSEADMDRALKAVGMPQCSTSTFNVLVKARFENSTWVPYCLLFRVLGTRA